MIRRSALPLLGATVIAILAFAPIGLSQDSTGEYCKSLFSAADFTHAELVLSVNHHASTD